MQNVFEVKFAKMPDEPLEQSEADSDSGGKDDAKAIESHSEPSSNSSSDSEDSEEEREKRLEELQAQVCSCVIIHSLQMEAVGVTSQTPSCGYGAQLSQGPAPVAWWWIIHCFEIITLCVSMLVGLNFTDSVQLIQIYTFPQDGKRLMVESIAFPFVYLYKASL